MTLGQSCNIAQGTPVLHMGHPASSRRTSLPPPQLHWPHSGRPPRCPCLSASVHLHPHSCGDRLTPAHPPHILTAQGSPAEDPRQSWHSLLKPQPRLPAAPGVLCPPGFWSLGVRAQSPQPSKPTPASGFSQAVGPVISFLSPLSSSCSLFRSQPKTHFLGALTLATTLGET